MLDIEQTITLVANLGVIAGIIFLALEVKQNTRAVRSQTSQGIQDQLGQVYSIITTGPMAEIYLDGMADPEQLDRVERAKFHALLSLISGAFENIFVQVREGSYAEARAKGWWQVLRNFMEYPGMRRHWDERSYIYSEDYRAFVEGPVMALKPQSGTTILEPID